MIAANRLLTGLLLMLGACRLIPAERVEQAVDPDGDGYAWPEDCDDANAAVHPQADEVCDGLDNDCDGEVDEDSQHWKRYYRDEDGDGYGRNAEWFDGCEPATGFSAEPGDCDDQAPGVHPDAQEICFDGRDTNCDALPGDCDLDGEISLAGLPVVLVGASSGALAGTSLAGIGDANGDGYDDFAVGAPLESAGGETAGAVYLVAGPLTAGMSLSDATAIIKGSAAGDYLGVAVASCGAHGGNNQLVVGAHLASGSHEDGGGAAWMVDPAAAMSSGGGSLAAEDARLSGLEGGDWLGWSVAALGDLDEDGEEDLAAGAPQWAGGDGQIHLSCSGAGSDSSLEHLGEDSSRLGWSMSGGRDVDGDGVADLLVGEQGADRAWLLTGADGNCGWDDAIALVGPQGSEVGTAVALVGDVDRDGKADLLMGAPGLSENGEDSGGAYLLAGCPTGDVLLAEGASGVSTSILLGEEHDHRAGLAVASAGYVNDDRYCDVLVGAERYDGQHEDMGAVYLVWGPPSSGEHDLDNAGVIFVGEAVGDYAGSAVAAAGDVNGDGLDDFLIGANEHDGTGLSSGAVYLVYGGGW